MEIIRYQAAGGIVVDGERLLLLQKPALGEVVLPKGHVEPGETLEATALRETREETGYHNLRLLAPLGTLQSQYPRENRWYIRDETYFLMALDDESAADLADYDDADHDRIAFERYWAPLDEAAEALSFEPARTFVRRAVKEVKRLDELGR